MKATLITQFKDISPAGEIIDDDEHPYEFAGIDQLIEDFLAEVETWKSAH